MPTYQYACTECGHELEAVQSFSDAALTECPRCQGRLRKVFGSVGVVFKGSGFYRTDSRSAPAKEGAAAGSPSGAKDSSGPGDATGTTSTGAAGGATGDSSNGSSKGSPKGSSNGSSGGGSSKGGSARSSSAPAGSAA